MVLIIPNFYENFIQNKYQDLIFIVIHFNLLFTRIGFFEQKFFMKFLFSFDFFLSFLNKRLNFPDEIHGVIGKCLRNNFRPQIKHRPIDEYPRKNLHLGRKWVKWSIRFMHSSLKVCKLLWIWSWHHLQIQTFGSIEDWVIGKN